MINADACLRAGMAELARQTRALGQIHGAKEALSRIGRPCCALELSFERVVLVGIVVCDDGVITHEVNQIVNDVLKVRLLLQFGQ